MGSERVKGVQPSDKVIARRVESYQQSLVKQAERARGLLQFLSDIATERGIFPDANFVYPPNIFSNRMIGGMLEPALYVDVEYRPKGYKEFVLLKEGANLIRYQDRRKRPNGELVYNAEGAEKISDIEYPFWAFWAAQELQYLIKKDRQPVKQMV